ncbi:hypothetical protein GCM10010353_35230 [Streptomyces chryseus]|nr:hypothetical protein GCM10010353_35230 [Streptomyces chryseus]
MTGVRGRAVFSPAAGRQYDGGGAADRETVGGHGGATHVFAHGTSGMTVEGVTAGRSGRARRSRLYAQELQFAQ